MRSVLAIVDKLIPQFFLQGWDIEIQIFKEADENENVAAKMQSKNSYRMATLLIYPRFFKETKEKRFEIIVHELCHIITGIQNGLINTAAKGIQITEPELAYAYEEETSWFAQILCKLLT